MDIRKQIQNLNKKREKTVEAYFVEKWKGVCKKYIQGEGFPDRIAIIYEYCFLVELKKSVDGVLSPLQISVHKNLHAQGIPTYVLSTNKEVDDFIYAVDLFIRLASKERLNRIYVRTKGLL